MSEMERVPRGVDVSRPSSARIFDYLLGGKDNYEIDQVVARRILALAPCTRTLAWFSRRFLVHAVQLAAEAGVRQFIDVGAGIPSSPNTHETAHKFDTSARVVYVDNDPVVVAHTNVMVAKTPEVTVMREDIRRTGDLLDRLHTEAGIDFAEPVAVLLTGVLHYVMDDEHPADIVAAFRDSTAPGSYLALTHQSDQSDPDLIAQLMTDTNATPAQCVFRSAEAIAQFAAGWEALDPGLTPIQHWLGDDLPTTRLELLGGVYRRRMNGSIGTIGGEVVKMCRRGARLSLRPAILARWGCDE